MSKNNYFLDFFELLQKEVGSIEGPASVILIHEYGKNPFLILISCLLSLRTRDVMTVRVSRALFVLIHTPIELANMEIGKIESVIRSTGFYKKKAQVLHEVASILVERYQGIVPNTREELLKIPGIGLKTANLVLSEAFDVPAICVDTHVHKISNLVGLVSTKTPEETERALQLVVPADLQRDFSRFMVLVGQLPLDKKRDFLKKTLQIKNVYP